MKALVTRPAEQAASLVAALGERGIEAILEPLLAIRFLPDGAQRLAPLLAGAQAILFTSVNGVAAFAAASAARDLEVFAVGDATSAAALGAGFARVESAHGNVEDLARLVKERTAPSEGALVHAAASEVAGDLAGRLGAAGFELRRAVLYEARPAEALSASAADAIRRGEIGYVLLFSPRTAATFAGLITAAGLRERCRGIAAIALSAAVAAALGDLPLAAVRVAAAPTEPALLAALDAGIGDAPQRKAVG